MDLPQLQARFNNRRDLLLGRWERSRLRNKQFSIVSNDCWGGVIYERLQMQYTTPFVGLMIMAPDYIRLLRELPRLLFSRLSFTEHSRYPDQERDRTLGIVGLYPIGLLDENVELHFLHCGSQRDAYESWQRRLARLDLDNLWVKFDGSKDYATRQCRLDYEALPFSNKVMFVRQGDDDVPSALSVPRWCVDGARMARRASVVFDHIGWLNGDSGMVEASRRRLRGLVLAGA